MSFKYLADTAHRPTALDAPPKLGLRPAGLETRRAPRQVDEDAVTLRLRPLRWRDRALPEALRWAGAAVSVAAVAGGFLFFASPSEAARIEVPRARTEPMGPSNTAGTTESALASSVEGRNPWSAFGSSRRSSSPLPPLEEEEEIIVIIDDEEDEEIVIFDDTLDASSAAALAEFHIDRSEHSVALEYAIRASEAEPKNRQYLYLLGDAYLLTKQRRAARKAFRRARRLRR